MNVFKNCFLKGAALAYDDRLHFGLLEHYVDCESAVYYIINIVMDGNNIG